MKINMSDINKRANSIVNQVAESRESVLVYKHGVPIVEICPVPKDAGKRKALQYLSQLQPVRVKTSIEGVIAESHKRGV